MSSNSKVSLRGASAKEITREDLLQKATIERTIRYEARRAAAAAQLIQRIWRGYIFVCKAEAVVRSDWDLYVARELSEYQSITSVDIITDRLLRPFLFFTRRYHFEENLGDDEKRFVVCFTILLQSINVPEPQQNYCSLSTGTKNQQRLWRYQTQKLLRLGCIGLVNGSAKQNAESCILASLSARMLVALTDSNLWLSIKEEDKVVTKVAISELLEWIAEGRVPLYPAVGVCLKQICLLKQEFGDKCMQVEKEKFLIVASAITVALRPLQQSSIESNPCTIGRQSLITQKASEDFCLFVLTVPYLVQRLPLAILPALQHSSVFSKCLQAFEGFTDFDSRYANSRHLHMRLQNKSQPVILENTNGNISPSAAALTNIIALSKQSKTNGSTNLLETLAFNSYLKAVSSLLNQLLQWLKCLKSSPEEHVEDSTYRCLQHTAESCECNKHPDCLSQADVRLQLRKDLEPLCEYWHLKQLLDQSCGMSLLEADSAETVLSFPDIAILYSRLSTVFKLLHEEKIPCPVLNLLAFAPGFLCQLWSWLDNAFGLRQCCSELTGHKASETKGTAKYVSKLSPQKEERPNASLSSRWASAVSKIKGKGSSTDWVDLNVQVNEKDRTMHIWNLDPLKNGPMAISEKALHIFTLFCAAYSHLLMILDDKEFYEHQVPFSLNQQRVIAASLNTMVYSGLLSCSRQKFLPLLKVTRKCLNALYGRDCRRSFCPVSLWLAPAIGNRPPIPAAARALEVALASIRKGDYSQAPAIGYVLELIPHAIPFDSRVQIFREFVNSDKMIRKMAMGQGPTPITVAIRRDRLVEDAFAQLRPLGSRLKSGINVSFVNEHGLSEAGLDYGGLFKEFLTDLAKAAFDPGYGLFVQRNTDEGLLFPHHGAGKLQHGIQMLEFLGCIVGKAIYEGILLEFSFSHVFIWKLMGRYVFFDELSALDPELHQNLMYLKHYEGDAIDLALDFTVTEEAFGKRKVVELTPGGSHIQVTNENKLQYIYAMADYKLNKQMQPLIEAFSGGLSEIISLAWLNLFNARELNQLISGGEHDFDVSDLKANTQYTGGFTEASRTVRQFWEVLSEFDAHERCAFLKFVTSCSRAPLLGFKHLQPAFTIHKVSCDTTVWAMLGGQDVDRLPTASTCYNTLKLPTYKRINTLRTKLRYAIHSNAGFELS